MFDTMNSIRWWDSEDEHQATSRLVQAIQTIQQGDQERQDDAVTHAQLYGEAHVFGYERRSGVRKTRVTMNLIKSATDDVVSRIVKNKPRADFQATGGNRSLRRKAKNLTRYVDYAMEAGKAKKAFHAAFLDAAVIGTGFVHVYMQGTKTCFERIFPSEILIDQQEGLYGEPRTMYRRKWAPKESLRAQFKDKEAAIAAASPPSHALLDNTMHDRTDLVEVYEAWRLPSLPGAKDGSHIIATDKGVLRQEKWTFDDFPIITIRFNPRLSGFFGIGTSEVLVGMQVELNKNLFKRQRILDLHAVPKMFAEGKAPKRVKMTNSIEMNIYSGKPPIMWNPGTMPPEITPYIMEVWTNGHSMVGAQAANARDIPAGVDSGVAIREWDAVMDGKLAVPHQNYQDAWMEAAHWCVRWGKEIAKRNPKWSPVAANDKYTVSVVDWDDINMEKDEYVIRAMPASALPTHPSGRKQMVIDMLQNGIISDPQEARRLIDFPDLEEANALDRSQSDYLDWVAEQILDEGIMIAPEPFQDHQLALKRMQAEYHRAAQTGVPEDRLAMLIDYMSATRDHVKAAQAEQAQLLAPASVGAPPATGFDGAPPTAVQPGDSPIPSQ